MYVLISFRDSITAAESTRRGLLALGEVSSGP